MKHLKLFFLFIVIASCIEPYDFVVHDNTRTLVIEAYISNKSFTESQSYPSDGRYFVAKLSYSGDVTNVRPTMVTGAFIELISDQDDHWEYIESTEEKGVYELRDDNFKALQGNKYKLRVSISSEDVYESEWEELPKVETPPMGNVSFTETEVKKYIIESGEKSLKTVKGVTAKVEVPPNSTREQIFYRWQFIPLWIYIAPLTSSSSEGYKCWATDKNYIPNYSLQIDNVGGYQEDLFFMETVRNERLFEDMSVLIIQHSVKQKNFNFWKELMEQSQGRDIFDSPPYSLQSNIHSLTDGKIMSGYFSVVQEQAKRWYFNIDDLSYNVINTLKADCLVDYGPGPPAPECLDCREYSFGKSTNIKPLWWRK